MPHYSLLSLTLTTLILNLTLIPLISCQNSPPTFRPYTSTYIVKFFKATASELQNLQDNNPILTQIQFLQKLVRNTSGVLNQAVFYVNFTVQVPANVNPSNLPTNKNNAIDINTNQARSPILPTVISIPTIQPMNFPNNTNPAIGLNNLNNSKINVNQIPKNNRNDSVGINGTLGLFNLSNELGGLNSTSLNVTNIQKMNSSGLTRSDNTLNTILNPFINLPNSTLTLLTTKTQQKKQAKIQNKIINKQFPGIGLYHNLPTNFIQNQVYKFAGVLTDPTMVFIADSAFSDVNFVNIIFSQVQGNQEVKCVDRVTKKKLEFQISCPLRINGSFYISIFSGNSGFSSNTIRNIFSPAIKSSIIKSTQLPPKPQNLYIQILDGELYIKWSSRSPLTKITFTQQSQQIQLILTNNHQQFLIPYHLFNKFDQIKTNITISHANSKLDGLYGISSMFGDRMRVTINPVQHMHSNNNENVYQLQTQLVTKIPVDSGFSFNGIFNVSAQNQIFIVSPYNQVTKLYFDTKLKNANARMDGSSPGGILLPGTPAKFNYSFSQQGVYLLEINQDTGLAIINQPIYVGDVYPLLPDYIDIKIQSILDRSDLVSALEQYVQSIYPKSGKISEPPKISSLQSKRTYMLTLLNLLRTKQIINPVYVDSRLTKIAQNHSNDMALNGYFSHNNIKGEGPGQRAKNFGFYFAIGENVAQSGSLTQAHLSLQRSAAHFENSLNKIWTRVGIGINQTVFGQYLVTFQFSSRDIQLEPLTKAELENHQKQLITMIKRKFPNIKEQSSKASNLILQWMLSNRALPLPQYLMSKGQKQQLLNNSIKFTYYPNFVEQIEKSDGLFGDVANYNRIAANIGLSKADDTVLECYFVFLQVQE